MPTTTKPRVRVRWTAARDGVAHAHRAGTPRTLCELPAIAERDGWPEQRRCLGCRSLADALETQR